MTGEHENVMKITSYEDGDWISNYFDSKAALVQKLVTVSSFYDSAFFEDALFAVAAVGGKLRS